MQRHYIASVNDPLSLFSLLITVEMEKNLLNQIKFVVTYVYKRIDTHNIILCISIYLIEIRYFFLLHLYNFRNMSLICYNYVIF